MFDHPSQNHKITKVLETNQRAGILRFDVRQISFLTQFQCDLMIFVSSQNQQKRSKRFKWQTIPINIKDINDEKKDNNNNKTNMNEKEWFLAQISTDWAEIRYARNFYDKCAITLYYKILISDVFETDIYWKDLKIKEMECVIEKRDNVKFNSDLLHFDSLVIKNGGILRAEQLSDAKHIQNIQKEKYGSLKIECESQIIIEENGKIISSHCGYTVMEIGYSMCIVAGDIVYIFIKTYHIDP